jgi:hypothetical protein
MTWPLYPRPELESPQDRLVVIKGPSQRSYRRYTKKRAILAKMLNCSLNLPFPSQLRSQPARAVGGDGVYLELAKVFG